MKAQTSFLMKGIYLIFVLIAIAIVSHLVVNYYRTLAADAEELEMRTQAIKILDALTGFEKCLALRDVATIQDKKLELGQARVVDLKKLQEFSKKFSEYEPNCARDFKYRYRIKIETLPIDLRTKEVIFESEKVCRKVCYQSYVRKCYWVCDIIVTDKSKTVNVDIPKESWIFGVNAFSRDEAIERKITISTPVIVYYDQSKLMPATLWIEIADGELERFSNAIDESCLIGRKIDSNFFFSYPIYEEKRYGRNYLCMEAKERVCQRLACEKEIEFDNITTAGNYRIIVEANNIIKVRT